jgi:hypothetical protein
MPHLGRSSGQSPLQHGPGTQLQAQDPERAHHAGRRTGHQDPAEAAWAVTDCVHGSGSGTVTTRISDTSGRKGSATWSFDKNYWNERGSYDRYTSCAYVPHEILDVMK